jgi:tRNA (cmo5U34)-methyltransferase
MGTSPFGQSEIRPATAWGGLQAVKKGCRRPMTKDRVYRKPRCHVPPFEFDEHVAGVFDDMIRRSVPFYQEIIDRQVQLILRYYQPGTRIYDLGCSNGNLGLALFGRMREAEFEMIAVDNSVPMLDAYRARLKDMPYRGRIRLHQQDIRQVSIENASVTVLNFTLQFLTTNERGAVIRNLYDGLNPGAVLLLCEKVTHPDPALAQLQQELYFDFKRRNDYSELEISQKREALEKVLVPETMEQHLQRLKQAGFNSIDIWFKWFNFAAMIAVK